MFIPEIVKFSCTMIFFRCMYKLRFQFSLKAFKTVLTVSTVNLNIPKRNFVLYLKMYFDIRQLKYFKLILSDLKKSLHSLLKYF